MKYISEMCICWYFKDLPVFYNVRNEQYESYVVFISTAAPCWDHANVCGFLQT
jgi:hypothetical protein